MDYKCEQVECTVQKMDDWSAAQKQWIEILFKHSIHFFFLSFFSLHVSVLFPSCVISPVSLYLVSDTRVSNMPRPGCRTCRDPDVEHAETRMSDMSRPGCHAMPFRISVFSFRLPLFLSARMRIYYNVSLLPGFPSSLKNMFFNIFINQRVTKKFSYSV